MNYRSLGNSELRVSEICLGTWTTFGGSLDEDAAVALVDAASDVGVNFYLTPDRLDRVDRLRPIADGLGIAMVQLALAWILRKANVASAIVGASRPEQLRDNASASGASLEASTPEAIDAVFA